MVESKFVCKHSGGAWINEWLNQYMVVSIQVVAGVMNGRIGCKQSGGGGINEWLYQ